MAEMNCGGIFVCGVGLREARGTRAREREKSLQRARENINVPAPETRERTCV